MKAADLNKRLRGQQPPCVVDVRSGFEYRSGHIPGALHAPLWKIIFRLARLPQDRQVLVVVVCEHGPRAEMARTLLVKRGYRAELLDGQMAAWRKAALPLEK
ncbi:rhodanese-like domain-containing protein [Desulfuromonas sp. KJ2020]|uniref:rhodanese-like domain-containing protein n=1 Tax=Desulfuromonas sp. KJ2020 TaxID=2919173 RepID=UPI0003267405|nr:rhodanese-like domain-containing protein [Desulfuromonas sp. KJ2020]MCP3177675.1 rhodanese-like domain-containing protein [Desulfuromonas sp. KJ2020]